MPEVSENQNASAGNRGWHGDPQGHAEAGRKGGVKVASDRDHMSEIGRIGGARIARDRAYMAEIGRRGGQKAAASRKSASTAA